MQTTRPRITWKVLPMAQGRFQIFKEIFDQVRKDLDQQSFYSSNQNVTIKSPTLYLLSSHR